MRQRYKPRYRSSTALLQSWIGALKDEPCFIVGNGWSLPVDELPLLADRFTIGINRAWKLLDPTILLWQDQQITNEGAREIEAMQCLKYQPTINAPRNGYLRFQQRVKAATMPPSPVFVHGIPQSALYAFQLAYLLGCNPIVLLGCDCRYKPDGQTSFFGVNRFHSARTLPNCVQGLEWMRDNAGERRIVSCSRNAVFPFVSLVDSITPFSQGKERQFYLERLSFR
jgi:hypothetical protein